MSVTTGNFASCDLKFLELKSYQLTGETVSDSGLCLSIDQKSQTVFVCCQNQLVYVSLRSLLNFEAWTKELLKNVDNQANDKVTVKIGQSAVSHLVSVSSKGFGSKLVVASHDIQNSSLCLFFFHLESLYNQKETCTYYNQFNFPTNGSRVRMLLWHPELSDNVFACSLDDGSFYVIYVSDSDQKKVTVLYHLTSDRNVSAFSWSPKGKQIAISYKDSRFSQFKFQINENNLVQSGPFQEVKEIKLVDPFQRFQVINIHWVSTFLFVLVCMNPEDDGDTHYMLASIPSSKATGPDAVIKFVDFNCININSIDTTKNLQVDLLPLENLIFSYTNKSGEFPLLGCLNSSEIASWGKWCEICFEEDVNKLAISLELAKPDGLVRGLVITRGTDKKFQHTGLVKGGPDQPLACIYNCLGQLVIFLVESPSELSFHVPGPPAKVTKPSAQSLPVQSAPKALSAPSKQLVAPPPINPGINSSVASSIPSLVPALSNLNSTNTFFGSTPQQNTVSTGVIPPTKPSSQPVAINQTVTKPEVRVNTKQESSKPSETDFDKLYVEEISSNIKDFDKELKTVIASLKKTLNSTEIGTSEQFEKIKCETEFILQMLNKLMDSYNTLNLDINELQTSFVELQYMFDETRTLLDRSTDPKYRNILHQRSLDPMTARRMKDIIHLRDYIDVQLRELNSKFDVEWQEWLQKKKKSVFHSSRSLRLRSPTSPHVSFMEERSSKKDLEDGPGDFTKTLYKALSNNQLLIESLKRQLYVIEKNFILKNGQTLGSAPSDVTRLTSMLHKVSLVSNGVSNQKKLELSCMEPKRKEALKAFLESRKSVPVRVCGLPEGNLSEKSRFISCLEKIKVKKHEKALQEESSKVDMNSITNITACQVSAAPKPTQSASISLGSAKVNLAQPVSPPQPMSASKPAMTTLNKPITELNFQQPTFENISPPSSSSSEVPTFSFQMKPNKTTTVETKVTISLPSKSSITASTSASNLNLNESKPPAAFSFANLPKTSTLSASIKPPSSVSPTTTAVAALASTQSSLAFSLSVSSANQNKTTTNAPTFSSFAFSTGASATTSLLPSSKSSNSTPLSLTTTKSSTFTSLFSNTTNEDSKLVTTIEPSKTSINLQTVNSTQKVTENLPTLTTTTTATVSGTTKPLVLSVPAETVVTTEVSKPTFSFMQTFSNLNQNQENSTSETKTEILTTTISPASTSLPASTTSQIASSGGFKFGNRTTTTTIGNTSSALSAPKSTFPAFSTSLFQTPKTSDSTSVTTSSVSPPASSPLNLNTSSFSLSGSFNTSTTSQAVASSSSGIFTGFGQSLSQSQSKPPSFGTVTTTASGSLDTTLNGLKLCSPEQPKSTNSVSNFANFGFGGTSSTLSSAQSPSSLFSSNNTSSPFASNTSPSLFASNTSSNSLFLSNTSNSPFASSVTNFSNVQQSPSSPFGSSPFASPAPTQFGAAPKIASSPQFGGSPAFGGGPSFGGSAFGFTAQPSFPNSNTTQAFSNFEMQGEACSFASIAGDTNQSTGFGSTGGSSFFATPNYANTDAFSQRRS